MADSSLVSYERYSPNCSSRNGSKVVKLTPHHAAGNVSVETMGGLFANPERGASANYGIGSDGRTAQYVREYMRPWTSSSYDNDRQAITVEVANDGGAPDWHVSDKAFDSLVALAIDICRRHGLDSLTWTGDKSGTITAHYMFVATTCMGPYLTSKMPELARRVNEALGAGTPVPSVPQTPVPKPDKTGTGFGGTYVCQADGCRVRCAPSLSGQIVAQYNRGQTVVLDDWYVSKDGWIWGRYTGAQSGQKRYVAVGRPTGKPEPDDLWIKKGGAPAAPVSIGVGSSVIVSNPVDWNGTSLAVSGTYKVMELKGARAVIGRGGVVTAAINVSNLRLA